MAPGFYFEKPTPVLLVLVIAETAHPLHSRAGVCVCTQLVFLFFFFLWNIFDDQFSWRSERVKRAHLLAEETCGQRVPARWVGTTFLSLPWYFAIE